MLAINSKVKLQLKVFAPAITLAAAGGVLDAVHLHRLPPFPPQLLNALALTYVGLVHLAAPGNLVLAVASARRNHSLKTLRWIGVGWIVIAFMSMASTAEKIVSGRP